VPQLSPVQCFACGSGVDLATGERIGFRDTCVTCASDLHACRNCTHHDRSVYNECREPGAERVGNRERANRCEWFRPIEGGEASAGEERDEAHAAFDDLFKK
jgi:hypothetical protein